jgi:SAM-dependent methyltransferase
MRHMDSWKPTKYTLRRGQLSASTDVGELAVGSRLMASKIAREYERAIPANASGTMLDLGCGKVPLYGVYRPFVNDVICIDWPGSLHGGRHVDAYCDLASSVPLKDGIADTILSSDVLEHLPDPRGFFEEVSRLLRPAGVLLLNTPFLYRVHEAPHDYLRHTRYSLQAHAEGVGLEIVELKEVGSVADVLADTVAKLVATVPIVGGPLARTVQALAIRFGDTALGTRLARITGPAFPLAHLLVARRPAPALGGAPAG